MHFWTFSNLESRCLPVGVMPLHLHKVRMSCVLRSNGMRTKCGFPELTVGNDKGIDHYLEKKLKTIIDLAEDTRVLISKFTPAILLQLVHHKL